MTEEEAALARFLITRFREAREAPGPKTLDGLSLALAVGHRRVRAALEMCFSDPNLEADARRELLVMYSGLDRWMDGFRLAKSQDDETWLAAANGLIQRLERAYAMAETHRPSSARDSLPLSEDIERTKVELSGRTEPTPDIEDLKTTIYRKPDEPAPKPASPSTERYG